MGIGRATQDNRSDVGGDDGMVLDWDVRTIRSRWHRAPRMTWNEARVVSVSRGGACVLAPTDRDDRLEGRRIRIGSGGSFGVAIVQWARPDEASGMTMCGVTFEDLQPRLATRLMRRQAAVEPAATERFGTGGAGAWPSGPEHNDRLTYSWSRETATA